MKRAWALFSIAAAIGCSSPAEDEPAEADESAASVATTAVARCRNVVAKGEFESETDARARCLSERAQKYLDFRLTERDEALARRGAKKTSASEGRPTIVFEGQSCFDDRGDKTHLQTDARLWQAWDQAQYAADFASWLYEVTDGVQTSLFREVRLCPRERVIQKIEKKSAWEDAKNAFWSAMGRDDRGRVLLSSNLLYVGVDESETRTATQLESAWTSGQHLDNMALLRSKVIGPVTMWSVVNPSSDLNILLRKGVRAVASRFRERIVGTKTGTKTQGVIEVARILGLVAEGTLTGRPLAQPSPGRSTFGECVKSKVEKLDAATANKVLTEWAKELDDAANIQAMSEAVTTTRSRRVTTKDWSFQFCAVGVRNAHDISVNVRMLSDNPKTGEFRKYLSVTDEERVERDVLTAQISLVCTNANDYVNVSVALSKLFDASVKLDRALETATLNIALGRVLGQSCDVAKDPNAAE